MTTDPICPSCRTTYHHGAMLCWQCGSVVDRWQYAKELACVGMVGPVVIIVMIVAMDWVVQGPISTWLRATLGL